MTRTSLLTLLLSVAVLGCSTGPMNNPDTGVRINTGALSADATIVANAQAQPELSRLVAALQRAGLVNALSGDGPYTVFAPINAAFDRADAGAMSPEDLAATLRYHVVEGDVPASSLVDGMQVGTLHGEEITVTVRETGERTIQVDDADVIYADIEASNGRIHIINRVLTPLAQGVPGVE